MTGWVLAVVDAVLDVDLSVAVTLVWLTVAIQDKMLVSCVDEVVMAALRAVMDNREGAVRSDGLCCLDDNTTH